VSTEKHQTVGKGECVCTAFFFASYLFFSAFPFFSFRSRFSSCFLLCVVILRVVVYLSFSFPLRRVSHKNKTVSVVRLSKEKDCTSLINPSSALSLALSSFVFEVDEATKGSKRE